MKTLYLFIAVSLLLGYDKDQSEPGEVKATITSFSIAVTVCMGSRV